MRSCYCYVFIVTPSFNVSIHGTLWNRFNNNIGLVGGDEWHGGNLSYHLSSRPKWDNILEKNNDFNSTKSINGFVLIGEGDILNKICVGYFFEIEKQGVCMIGTKKWRNI